MARLIRRKEVSPVELIDVHLARIAQLNPRLNAFVEVRAVAARQEALCAEAAVSRGEKLGILHGVPVSIKSCIDVAGMRCEAGTRLRHGMIASSDAPLVQRLKAAGAIVLGNTNVPEMLMAYETDNLLYGTAKNPWDLERTSGGSSGGEAAAIAACLSAAGVGSDAGGSIRVPAHFSGICGLKPTNGRVPGTGHFPQGLGPFAMLGVVGPMARTVADLQLMFIAMAGPDWGDAAAIPKMAHSESGSTGKTRIGYFEEDGICPATDETRLAVRNAAEALRGQGYDVVPFRPSILQKAWEFWWTCFVLVGAEVLKPAFAGRDNDISPTLKDFFSIADRSPRALSKESLLEAWFGRDEIRVQMLAEMQQQQITAMLSPVCAIPAFKHGEREWKIRETTVHYLQVMSYSQHFNLLGNPAVVVPVAHSEEGLPIGVQIIGKPYDDEYILDIAAKLDSQFGWREPPLLKPDATILQ